MANNTNTQVYVGFLFPTRKTRINCPKIDGNEAIFINLQFVLRARHNFVVNSSWTKTITFHLRKTTTLMFRLVIFCLHQGTVENGIRSILWQAWKQQPLR